MPRLRPLSEAECYARLYRGWEATVTIVRLEPRPRRSREILVGEELRRLFEDKLDLRDPERFDEEAA